MAAALIVGLVSLEQPLLILLVVGAVRVANGPGWKLAVLGSFLFGIIFWPSPVLRVGDERPFLAEATVDTIPINVKAITRCVIESGGNQYVLDYFRTRPIGRGHDFKIITTGPHLSRGDVIKIKGTVLPLSPGQRAVNLFRNVSGIVRPETDGITVIRRGPLLFQAGVFWRDSFREFSISKLEPRASAALNALCFNDTSELDVRTYLNLQRSGTVHIISASGLHVLIFALGLNVALGFLPIPRGLRLLIIGVILLLYSVGAGMRPPVVRSVAMAGILGLSSYLRREPDLLSALGITAFGYLLWRPFHVYDIGFQLSFVTVAALGMFVQLSDDESKRAVKRLWDGVLQVSKASLVATIASAPLTAYYFGMVSLVSIPANVLIALTLPALTLSAFFAHAIAGLLPALATGIMIVIVQPLTGWVLWVTEAFGSLSFAAAEVPAFSPWWMIPYYALLLAFWKPKPRPVRASD